MTGLHTRSQSQAGTPKPFILAWQARQSAPLGRAEMIEATMRRHEMASVVDVAKRDGMVAQLSRMLDF